MKAELLIAASISLVSAREPIVLPIQRNAKSTVSSSMARAKAMNSKFIVDPATAPLKNEIVLYSCPVYVGDGQHLELDLDTGSADMWVFGSNCTSVDGSCSHPKINLNDTSITQVVPAQSFRVYYGSGNVTADIYRAPVTVANETAMLPIGVASNAYGMKSTNGLIGLAFNGLSEISYKLNTTARPPFAPENNANFFDQLDFPEYQRMFSFYLSNYDDGDSGQVTFGGFDETKFTGDIHWVDVLSVDITKLGFRQTDPPTPPTLFWWLFDLNEWTVSVNGTVPIVNQSLASGQFNTSIADTGTTLIILGYDIARAINTAIGGAFNPKTGYYDLNCTASYPDVTFHHDGFDFNLPSSFYLFKLSNVHCISGIIGQKDHKGNNFALFGDIFLRAFYSIYDKSFDSPRIGFAKAVHPSK
ncbi:Type I transmembrane sorting receptor [Boothiomyces macroporosus]|uniref:Type I transmembrane sorting receptor n=1 Tax=Boothiomyces macroporosus TaxID=261099 RepID=A0AAD5Y6Q6_9FUNG|nr:Type I transmembrane sorting receptor [Boothiomyces macroporosus]